MTGLKSVIFRIISRSGGEEGVIAASLERFPHGSHDLLAGPA
jgi:hypothetical protein